MVDEDHRRCGSVPAGIADREKFRTAHLGFVVGLQSSVGCTALLPAPPYPEHRPFQRVGGSRPGPRGWKRLRTRGVGSRRRWGHVGRPPLSEAPPVSLDGGPDRAGAPVVGSRAVRHTGPGAPTDGPLGRSGTVSYPRRLRVPPRGVEEPRVTSGRDRSPAEAPRRPDGPLATDPRPTVTLDPTPDAGGVVRPSDVSTGTDALDLGGGVVS